MDYQGTNLVPSLQPDPCTMHAYAAAEPGFDTINHDNPYLFPTRTANEPTSNAFPNTNTNIFANPANPFNTSAGASTTSSAQIPLAVPGPAAPARHHCTHPTCTSTFKLASDLHRHAKVHQPGARKYECFVPGCAYRGPRGFLRRDKLLSHQRNAHGLRY